MRHEKDHEKRVVLDDIPPDDTMISSLALCDKELMVISSHFVDQDEDNNTFHGFKDENQLYQALNMRTEHRQFAMNISATSIFDQKYLDDDDSQVPVMMMTPHWIIQKMILTQWNWMMTQMRYSLITSWLQLPSLGNPEELILNIFLRFGELVMKIPKRTIDVTTQTSIRTDDPASSRNTLQMILC